MTPFIALLPLWTILGGSLTLLLLEVTAGGKGRLAAPWIASFVIASALAINFSFWGHAPENFFSGAVQVDSLSLVLGATVLFAGLCGVLFGVSYLRREKAVTCEYFALLLLSIAGALVLAAAGDLLTALVGLELMSLPAYVLAGYLRRDSRCVEAALKYFLPGAVATAFMAYGAALVYGATGTLSFEGVRSIVAHGGGSTLLYAGAALVMATFAFKVAVVPFHAWSLDAYDGAPAPVSAFLTGSVKAAAFAVWLRLFHDTFPPGEDWRVLMGLLAVATMVVGNLGAFSQGSVKRMLAYSSMGQVGYILIGLAALGTAPFAEVSRAVVLYLMAYTLMAVGAFGWLAWASGDGEQARSFDAFRGYGRQHPVESACMSLFLLSLAGVPPTAGFFGKLLLFKLAVSQGYLVLALVAMVFSLLAFSYYLRLMVVMYMAPSADANSASFKGVAMLPSGRWHRVGLGLCALGTLVLGFVPLPF